MRTPVMLAVAALALWGCKKTPPPEPASAAPAEPAPAPEAQPDDPAAPANEKLALTADKLTRFIGYQQRMLEVTAQALKDVKAMDHKADAGDYGGVANDAVDSIGRKEEAEEAARKDSGLSEREVEQLEQLVGELLAKRSLARTMNFEATLKQMEELRAGLPKEQQAGLDQSLAELKKQQEEAKSLKEERDRFGSANVDLVLAREAELAKNQDKLMNLWSRP
ncbi:MAG: hypothetical protein ACYC8T_28280 [Myxococcaceae bacterium]